MSVSAPAAGARLLRFAGADLGYGATAVLRNVDLAVHAGEFWAVVGRNGTGKSTLLRTIVGELPPVVGTLDRHDDLTIGRRLAWVPQHVELNPVLPSTVREFASLGLAGLGLAAAERRRRQDDALATVGLAELARADVRRLSGGQRQRCLLARALVRQPLLLVLDEPTAGLDAAAEAGFHSTLVDLHRRQGLAVVLVTHDLEVARTLATRIACCADGAVRCAPASAPLAAAAAGVPAPDGGGAPSGAGR